MKLVKTDWRNSLTDEAVTDLIRIALHSADIKEFNPDQAVRQWKKASIRGRRPNQSVWKKKKKESKGSQQIQDSNSVSYDSESNVDDIFTSDADTSEQPDEELGHAVAASPVPDDFLAMFDSDSAESDFDGF